MCGFSKGLGCCNAYIAELWGVFESLKIICSRGIQKLELHVDSSVVVSTITSTKGGSATAWSLLQNIRKLLSLNWEVRIQHSYEKQMFVQMHWEIWLVRGFFLGFI